MKQLRVTSYLSDPQSKTAKEQPILSYNQRLNLKVIKSYKEKPCSY